MKKKLLIFAHRGEARAFLQHFDHQALPDMDGLYECAEHFLLLTGEGPWKAGPKTGLVLGKWGEQVSQVINLGIAGSLRPDVETGIISPIRTVFLETGGEMQFSSHLLSDKGLDLITCHHRVINPELAERLDAFAPLVDRELWSLAQITSHSGHKLQAFKLISDKVGDEEICQRVKERTDEFSNRLLDFYLSFKTEDSNLEASPSEEWEGFYFTTSMQNLRDKLFQSLCIKLETPEKALESLNLHELRELDEAPKKKALEVIQRMKDILNPAQKEINKTLEELTEGLQSAGAMVKFPKEMERAQFHLSAHINQPEDLVALVKAMEEFDYNKLVDTVEGRNLHV